MKISIIIAAYNVEKYIKKCIDSCLVQGVPGTDYEVIAVNDASTDNTLSILQAYENKIKIVNHESNRGLGASRNSGLAAAKGNYIWFIDGDDFIETAQVQSILTELKSSELDMYCMNYHITDENGMVKRTAYPTEKKTQMWAATSYYEQFKMNSYTWQYIFRKEIFLEHNLLFKQSINMQDSEIMPKIIFYSKSVKYLNIVAYNYVQHEFSFTNTNNFEKRLRYFHSIIEVNKSLGLFKIEIKDKNQALAKAIGEKQISLHEVVFNHVLFFTYEKAGFQKIINLLKQNNLYPLQHRATGKMKLLKTGLNNYPVVTKWLVDKMQAYKCSLP